MKAPICIILLAGLAASLATAAPDGPRGRSDGDRGPRQRMGDVGPGAERGHGPMHDRLRQARDQFDVNGDGELDEAERGAARESFEARRAERAAALLQTFDADGDGLLNAAELGALLETGRKQGPGGPGGPGGPEAMHGGRGRGGPGGHGDREALRERFDLDGDGTLNEAERQAAREQAESMRHEFHARMLEQFDANGDGELDKAEREAARDAHRADMDARRAEFMKEFDVNGDGELDQDEREAARETMKARHEGRRALREIDANRDRRIDADELAAAAELVRAGDPRADFNGDGVVNKEDLSFVAQRMGDDL